MLLKLSNPNRSHILWIGKNWTKATHEAAASRGLLLFKVDEEGPIDWIMGRAIVFSAPNAQLVQRIESELAALAISHGLRVFVLDESPELRQRLRKLPYGGRIYVWSHKGASSIPEQVARWDPGPNDSNGQKQDEPRLIGAGKCCLEDQILLRRAFADCSEVRFKDLTNDRRAIFQASAQLRSSQAGPYPLPFLVKLDSYTRVNKELGNYELATQHFIPFFARPNLDSRRCLLGPTRGLIVANFIENSTSLMSEVERGTAAGAISSLFEDALRGWRTQAFLSASNEVKGSLSPEGAVKARSEEHRNNLERCVVGARKFGCELSGTAIGELIDALPPITYRQALRHGDLHGENVRVRAGQAILIDFLQVDNGPLVDDPALLETSLVLSFKADFNEWKVVAEQLYLLGQLRALPSAKEPMAPLSELWNAVRQVRRYGLADQVSRDEYARAVATQLLRHGLRNGGGRKLSDRRSFMVYLSGRLAQALASDATSLADN